MDVIPLGTLVFRRSAIEVGGILYECHSWELWYKITPLKAGERIDGAEKGRSTLHKRGE